MHRQARPLLRHTVNVDVAATHAQRFANLIRTNAHALRALGTVERPEQALADELGLHAASRVRNHDATLAIFRRQLDVNFPVRLRRILRIANRMANRHQQTVAVRGSEGMTVGHRRRRCRRTVRTLRRGLQHELDQVDTLGRLRERVLLQVAHDTAHARDAALDRLDSIVDKCGVALVLDGILDDERLLRDRVFQIVHDVRREAAEGLELTALGELLGGCFAGQVACDLLPGRFQEVMVFEVQRGRRARPGQCHESNQAPFVKQRHDKRGLRQHGLDIDCRVQLIPVRVAAHIVEIDDPAGLGEKADERVLCGKFPFHRTGVPARHGMVVAPVVAEQPEMAGRRVNDLCERLNGALAKWQSGFAGRERLVEPQPFGAVVVFLFKKVLRDQHAHFRARLRRQQHDQEHEHRSAEKQDLQRRSPDRPEVLNVLAAENDRGQIKTRRHQCRAEEDHLARREYSLCPGRAAPHGKSDQRHAHGDDETAHIPQHLADLPGNSRMGIHEQVVHEESREAQA